MDISRIDAQKYTEAATAIRAAQPVHERSTTADDMAEELRQREERVAFHADRVWGYEEELGELEKKWTNLNDAVAAAEKLLATRPTLRHDIARWKEAMADIEADGDKLKKLLLNQRAILKQSKSDVKPLSDKNLRGFDFEKYERLKQEEAALRVL
jgi:hypothetical protein